MKIVHKQSVNNRRKLLSFALGIGVISGSAVQASVMVNTTVDYGPSSYNSPYNPNPAGNVLANLTPSASAGFFGGGGGGGLTRLTDTLYQTVTTSDATAFAAMGSDLGNSVTYSLDLSGAPDGYDIDSIITLGGWQNSGRDQQLYNVYYSTVAAPATFLQIGTTINYSPASGTPDSDPRSTQVTIVDNTSIPLATGVAALRFNFAPPDGPSGTENGFTGYAELIALASPTIIPEPSIALFMGLGGLLLFRRSKKE